MLKVKNLTLLSKKKEKKGGILNTVAKESSSARFFGNLVSRCRLILTNIFFPIEWK